VGRVRLRESQMHGQYPGQQWQPVLQRAAMA
jgi:hypothetical protein